MYIDIMLVVFLLMGIIQGFHRGVIRTLFAILGIVIGFLAALKFSPYVVTFFENTAKLSPRLSLILGLLLTFLVIMLGIWWLGKSFENTLKLVRINVINKIIGAVLFALLMLVTYSAIIWFLVKTDLVGEAEKQRSKSYPVLEEIPAKTGVVIEKLKPVFRDFWNKMDKAIHSEKNNGAIDEKE